MKEIIIATKNKGKVKDFEELFRKRNMTVLSLLDFPEIDDIEENGKTFAENAAIKAEALSRRIGKTVVADDSGLIVDALDGRPGIFSARYAGPEKNDRKNIEKVLQELEGVPVEKRTARFHCALAVAFLDRPTKIVEGTCEGKITTEPVGEHGFGYDPIMYLAEFGKTMAQLTSEQKNEISHRKQALKKLEADFELIFR